MTGPPASPKLVSSLATAQQRWKAVEKRLREALRRGADWPLLHEIDAVVGAYAEASKEGRGASEGLEMQMDDGFHRLMLHGVCQVSLRRFQGELSGWVGWIWKTGHLGKCHADGTNQERVES
jgi:hypothetical protein